MGGAYGEGGGEITNVGGRRVARAEVERRGGGWRVHVVHLGRRTVEEDELWQKIKGCD